MSTLFVNNLNTASGSTITVPSGKVLTAPGHVLQIVRASRNATSHESFATTSFAASSLSVSLTPKASGNKVLVECVIGMGAKRTDSEAMTALYIDGSKVSSTDGGAGNYWCGYWDTTRSFHGASGYYEYTTVDTNAHTFALYCKTYAGSGNFDLHSGASHAITCTEIAT